MGMSKQDFESIAEAVAEVKATILAWDWPPGNKSDALTGVNMLTEELVRSVLIPSNPRFDVARFNDRIDQLVEGMTRELSS